MRVAYLYEIIEVERLGMFCDLDVGRGYFRLNLKVKIKVRCNPNVALLESCMRKKTNTEIYLLFSNATQLSNAPLGICPC